MSRTLRLTSPFMTGGDVSLLQKNLNTRLAAWGAPRGVVTVDGEFGPQTLAHTKTVCYGLGVAQTTLRRGITPGIRRKIRDPRFRNPFELARSRQRRGWRDRVAKRLKDRLAGPRLALEFARRHVGVTERPPGSNIGGPITQWNKDVDCPFPIPWCGAFVNACLHAAGFPHQPWLRYTPWIVQKAQAGEGGWSWHRDPEPGDLVLFNWPGGAFVDHVGLVIDDDGPRTIEGNTSADNNGSQSNGGGVFQRNRSGAPIAGYARPPWGRL